MTAALGTIDVVIWGIITFSILVVLHEMGHFFAARAFGVKVHEFMIGLPGPALRLKTKNMAWGITAIPLGGYVRIAGMEPGAEDELLGAALAAIRDGRALGAETLAVALKITSLTRADALIATLLEWKAIEKNPDGSYRLTVDGDTEGLDEEALLSRARSVTYRGKSTSKRITILAMGVVTNLIVAILTFTVVLSIWGYPDYTTRIDLVETGAPAAAAGLRQGDTLVSLDGTPLEAWEDFQLLMAATAPGQSVTLEVVRNGQPLTFAIELAERDGHGYLGIGPTAVQVRLSVPESLVESLRLTGLVFTSIIDLFDPATFSTSVKGVRGVIGVSVMAAEAAHAGALSYAALIAMLSLSLGVMNIIPMPPLDGGKIVLEVVERVVGRPLGRGLTLGLSAAGALLLFSLIGYIMYADIVRIAQ